MPPSEFWKMTPNEGAFYLKKKYPHPTTNNMLDDVRDKAIAEGFNVA